MPPTWSVAAVRRSIPPRREAVGVERRPVERLCAVEVVEHPVGVREHGDRAVLLRQEPERHRRAEQQLEVQMVAAIDRPEGRVIRSEEGRIRGRVGTRSPFALEVGLSPALVVGDLPAEVQDHPAHVRLVPSPVPRRRRRTVLHIAGRRSLRACAGDPSQAEDYPHAPLARLAYQVPRGLVVAGGAGWTQRPPDPPRSQPVGGRKVVEEVALLGVVRGGVDPEDRRLRLPARRYGIPRPVCGARPAGLGERGATGNEQCESDQARTEAPDARSRVIPTRRH